MSDLLTPGDVEDLARQAGIPMAELCRRAGISPSIFSRWKSGETEPSLSNYRRIRDAAEAAAAAARRPRGRRLSADAAESAPTEAAG